MFPSALPTLTNPTSGTDPSVLSHAQQHTDANDNIEALCAKLGIGAATPVANRLLTGTGVGTSDWSKVTPNGTIVGTTDTQTLTNKTLTSPTINTPTIVNPTLQTDTISEYTSAAGVTVDGLLIKDGKINGNAITADTITDTQMDYPRFWHEIARTTLASASDTITASSIPARRYLMILYSVFDTGGAVGVGIRFNNDSGANYATAYSIDGAAVTTAPSATSILFRGGTQASAARGTMEIYNIATDEKVCTAVATLNNAAGAATVPANNTIAGKWVNTTDQITRVDLINVSGAGDFAIGSEVVVLGHD